MELDKTKAMKNDLLLMVLPDTYSNEAFSMSNGLEGAPNIPIKSVCFHDEAKYSLSFIHNHFSHSTSDSLSHFLSQSSDRPGPVVGNFFG